MPPPNKLSPDQLAGLQAAYEGWNPADPESESAEEVAARFGVSKQTMYKLRKKGWSYEGSGKIEDPARSGSNDLELVVRYLTETLVAEKIRTMELLTALEDCKSSQGPSK